MARQRIVKPEIWTSEQFTRCSFQARLLFIGLLNFADDHGIHPASAARSKMEVFPADPITIDEVARAAVELVEAELLFEYEAEGGSYWQITGFDKHQSVKHPNYRHPEPPEHSGNTPGTLPEDSGSATVALPTHSGSAPPAREEKRREENKEECSSCDEPPSKKPPSGNSSLSPEKSSAPFDRWWSIYPLKVGKAKCQNCFDRVLSKLSKIRGRPQALEWLMERTAEFAKSPKGQGEFCPHPSTWLNEGRYDDDPATWQRESMRASPRNGTEADLDALTKGFTK